MRAEQIETWFRSVLDIESVHWRAQLLIWLLGARSFLNGEITQPEQLKKWRPKIGQMQPSISWEYSHLLDGFYEGYPRRAEPDLFLKSENIVALKLAVAKFITPEFFFGWLDDFAKSDSLQSELLEMPDQFFETFIK